VADCDVLIPTVAKVDATLLAAAPRLRLIVQPAAGYQNIDTAAARCGAAQYPLDWTVRTAVAALSTRRDAIPCHR
jgi:phosphoglycerate dehydrogenase-like enzyme